MTNSRSLVILIYMLLVIVTVSAANSTPSFNVSVVRPPADSKCHNMYTYNNHFYAGGNKKVEALLQEVKNELSEMREEIKSLKENKTICKEPSNTTIKGLFLEVKLELSKLRDEVKCLKENKTINKAYKNCAELYKAGERLSGVYPINPDNASAFDVYCDQTTAGGGWTMLQKRLDGSVDFYRGWDDYKRGFGNLTGEFWLGLDKIHRLTQEQSRLRVDLEDTTGKTAYAEYDLFVVADEANKYKLRSIGTYSGTAGDSLSGHSGMAFSTKDRDNDVYSGNCATLYKGGWWYSKCHSSNLNGLYHHGQHSSYADGVNWRSWKGYYYSVKRAEMKIKPVNA